MTHAEVDAVQIEDAPVLLQWALAPGLELVLEIAIEPTDGASAGGHSHQRLGDFTYLVGACASHEHVGEALSDLRL
jgi:hypothetical protein